MRTKALIAFCLLVLTLVFLSCQKDSAIQGDIQMSAKQNSAITNTAVSSDEIENALVLGCYDPVLIDATKPCPRVIDPVCACGTITFTNSCEASRFGFTNTTKGACSLNICPNPALKEQMKNTTCSSVYDPVCGCDGKTYSNSCNAVVNGVAVFTPGECSGGLPLGL